MSFELHSRLAQDTFSLGHFQLCQLLLMNDSQYPWFILVPKRAALRELYQLTPQDQQVFMQESSYLAEQLALLYQPDKLNIASIGNKVPQLHIHHIVRYQTDNAWPEPVWGKFSRTPYTESELATTVANVTAQLQAQLLI